jgi:hypothetical protein
MITLWILVVLVGGDGATVWPGATSAYGIPEHYAREADCWRARRRVLLTLPLASYDGWKPVAATCVPVRVQSKGTP